MRYILEYTAYDSRDVVHEGVFEEINSKDFKIGDFFLTHHVCGYTGARILEQVIDKRKAYYFNGELIYNLITNNRGAYKSCLRHISQYDQIIRIVDKPLAERHLPKNNTKAYSIL